MKANKVPTTTKKGRRTQKSAKTIPADLFTLYCRTDLGLECVKEYKFHDTRRWRFDYAIPTHRIALEVEGGVWTGGRHTRAQGFLGDMEKYNTATLLGWRVFRTTPSKLYSAATIDMIKEAVQGGQNEKKL